jgi:uncharacterized protein YdhG (YjbR/CyaY superfamily)
MSRFRPPKDFLPLGDLPLPLKRRKPVPHQFVLDAIAPMQPYTRSMFGCLAVYVEGKIVLILRDKRNSTADNGVWLATDEEHHESLRRDFPSMRSIHVLGKGVTGWQVLPADAPDFEAAALRACEFVLARDPRIGKVPGARRISRSTTRTEKSPVKAKRSTAKRSVPKNVDEYLAGVPEPAHSTLNQLRALICSVVPPEATETISYGIPAFKDKKVLVWFAAFSNHCSLFPTASVIEAFKKELRGFTISKGTVQFPLDKPLPTALIKKLVKERIAQNEGRKRR